MEKDFVIFAIDFETTGLDSSAEVIEAAWTRVTPARGTVSLGPSLLYGADKIEPGARAVHHIWLEDLAGLNKFDPAFFLSHATDIGACGLAAHNAAFESQFLPSLQASGLHLICTYKCALRVWPDAPSHSNFALAYWLQDEGLIYIDRAAYHGAASHRAGPDCYVTGLMLQAMFAAGLTWREMIQITSEPALLPRCPIGEHRGKAWPDVDQGFLRWMVNKDGVSHDHKWCAQRELNRRNEVVL